jgi:hypothetical protein
MASQIAHIVYARKYFDRLEAAGAGEGNMPPENLNRDEFILGCVFPDIRLVDKNIKRKDTHLRFPVLDLNFFGLTSLEAGWKFHLYCDMRREEILNNHKFYSLKRTADFFGRPAKFLEDGVIYDRYNNWEKLANFFNNPPFINTDLGIQQETFNLWYAILAKYIETKPDIKSMRILLSKVNLSHKDEIIATIMELEKNKKAVEILGKASDEII